MTLLSGGKEISTYEYLTYNNIPGTVMLTHATELYDEGVTVKRNNDGKSFNSNLGNFENKGTPIYGVYDINVLEDGEYEAYIYFANEKGKTFTITIDDETSVEGQTGPENSANWDTYIPAPAVIIALTQGTHKLRVDFPAGGCNFKKIVFKKIDK